MRGLVLVSLCEGSRYLLAIFGAPDFGKFPYVVSLSLEACDPSCSRFLGIGALTLELLFLRGVS